jgi:hypothetical protein
MPSLITARSAASSGAFSSFGCVSDGPAPPVPLKPWQVTHSLAEQHAAGLHIVGRVRPCARAGAAGHEKCERQYRDGGSQSVCNIHPPNPDAQGRDR